MRRLAVLVAGGADASDVFASVAYEAAQVTGAALVQIQRYESDETVTVAGAWGAQPHPFQPGTNWGLEGSQIAATIKRTRRPVRVDDFGLGSGPIAEGVRKTGIRGGAGAPIIVDGELWGAIAAGPAKGEPVPPGLEERLAEFTELIGIAIAGAQTREAMVRLADEQAALRRVATLVARGVPTDALFAAVAEEVGTLLDADQAGMIRYLPDGATIPVATWAHPAVEHRARLDSGTLGQTIARTVRPARVDDATVGCPIVVESELWGGLLVHSTSARSLPADTESRLAAFTELVATAVANADARAELAASRARLVAAADDERRRVVRDLHDGAQQRLVLAAITLKQAESDLRGDAREAPALVERALAQVEAANAELRELAHGILPGVLTHGGLVAAVRSLASRMPLPVEVDVSVGRLPGMIEATAYFVVAEALTNVVKHAGARRATVTARVADDALRVEVSDDGVGGAQREGSGLLGLRDRLVAFDGTLVLASPPGGGTRVAASIPVPHG